MAAQRRKFGRSGWATRILSSPIHPQLRLSFFNRFSSLFSAPRSAMPLHEVVGEDSQKYHLTQGTIPDVNDPKQVFEVCQPWKVEPGSFCLFNRIGEGAYGVVFRSTLKGRTVAAKKLKDHVLLKRRCSDMVDEDKKDYQAIQAYNDLVTELAVLVSVGRHPNLVEFCGACISDETNPIIFEEFVSGPSLSNFFAKKSCGAEPFVPPRSVTYSWILDMMRGLEFLHNRDPVIIHRDMKPGNLLLTKDLTRLKITDFGMCKMVKRGQVGHGRGNAGTEAYMPPEVFHKDVAKYTDKVDIYSAAVIMWYIATGQGRVLHYRGDDVNWRPDLAWIEWDALKAIIQRSWAASPDQRPSATALLQDLQNMPEIPPPINPHVDFGAPGCQCSVQ